MPPIVIESAINSRAGQQEQRLPRLHQAALAGNIKEVEALIEAGEDPNRLDANGRSAVFHAAERNKAVTVRLLLSLGADPDPLKNAPESVARGFAPAPGAAPVSALHLAVFRNFDAVAYELVRCGADVELATVEGSRCLHLVEPTTSDAIIRLLIDAGADIEAVNDTGRTCLHLAAQVGNTAAARLMIEAGARPAPESHDGATPLHCAAEKGHFEIAELLLKSGAPPGFVKMPHGTTPLHMAAQENNISILRMLVRAGVPLDPTNMGWVTPLMSAAALGRPQAVSALISAGADANKRNALGQSPLDSVGLCPRGANNAGPQVTAGDMKSIVMSLWRAPAAVAGSWRWPAKEGRRSTTATTAKAVAIGGDSEKRPSRVEEAAVGRGSEAVAGRGKGGAGRVRSFVRRWKKRETGGAMRRGSAVVAGMARYAGKAW